MNTKKMNRVVGSMIALTVLSGGMFVYDNFILAQDEELQTIYVAKETIPAQTALKAEMFEAQAVPPGGVLPGYVTNLNEIAGKQLRGGLMRQEPLTKQRLSTEEDMSTDLEIKLLVDEASMTVSNNDYINLYVILNVNKEIQVRKVFDTRQVYRAEQVGDTPPPVTMKVTEDDLLKYYDAKERGKLIMVKKSTLDGNDNVADYNPESPEAQSATPPSEADGEGFITKEFVEGDTLDKLATQYKTDVETIKVLNEGKSDFKPGDKITLPSNN